MQTNSYQKTSRRILKKADRTISVPFELPLHGSDKPLYCEKVVRIIPGKRLVAFGLWDNKPVAAKLFFEWTKAKKHRQRDVSGIEILKTANVPTPQLYFQGTDQSKRIHVLIFERILDSYSLEMLWQEKGDIEELMPLMRAATIELATQHVLGIIQRDLHLKNFLVTSKTIYTLDGGSIEQVEGPLSKKESLEHLGLFFAQFGAGTAALQKYLFDLYAKSRGWIVRPADLELLQQSTKKCIAERWSRYRKKIMRNCTAFTRVEKLNSLTLYDREYQSDNFKKLLENPDLFFTKPDSTLLKSGRSSTVVKIKLDDRIFVIKRYNIKNIWHWLRRCLRSTRAEASWVLSHHLRLTNIPTAKPIAFIEKQFLGLRNKSYFIMEYVPGEHLGEFFAEHRTDEESLLKIVNRVVALFKQLAELQKTHGDLKMTNILINHTRPILIDLDGMQTHSSKHSFQQSAKKEIQRFMKNWESFPRVRDMFQELMK